MLFRFKNKKKQAVMKMIIPGRRALGEQWREVTIRPKEGSRGGFTVENQETAAPPQGRPVVIPAMANLSDEEVNFILGGALKAQDYYKRQNRKPSQAELIKEINQMWADYCEQKLKWFKGQTTLGPGGFYQREKPGITDWSMK
jgi:hypothetical protein